MNHLEHRLPQRIRQALEGFTKLSPIDAAFLEGWNDWALDVNECPYPLGTELANQWRDGFAARAQLDTNPTRRIGA